MPGHARAGMLPVLVVVLAAACAPAPATHGRTTVPPASSEARNLMLPLDTYELSPYDIQTVEAAEDTLTGACLHDQGIGWKTLPLAPGKDLNPPNRYRYGLIEADLARRFGYHRPPDPPSLEHRRASEDSREKGLTPQARRAAYGADGTGGCWSRAHARLLRGVPPSDHSLLNRLMLSTFDRSQREHDVVKALHAWSTCMRHSGFHYADPLAAAGDAAWGTSDRPVQKELNTALADVRCKEQTHLVVRWRGAETRVQTAAIQAHAKDFRALKNVKQRWLTNARQVLADTEG